MEQTASEFRHLSDKDVQEFLKGFIAAGMEEDEAYAEIHAIDSSMDNK